MQPFRPRTGESMAVTSNRIGLQGQTFVEWIFWRTPYVDRIEWHDDEHDSFTLTFKDQSTTVGDRSDIDAQAGAWNV